MTAKETKYSSRNTRLREEFAKWGIDAFFTLKPENIRYLSNFSGNNAILLVTETNTILFTDSRYGEEAEEETKSVVVKVGTSIIEELTGELDKGSAKSIGFESEHITHAQYKKTGEMSPNIRLIPTYNSVEEKRIVKDRDEIEAIKGAIDIAGNSLQSIIKHLRPNTTEREISAELEYQIRKGGAEGIAFDFIVVSGKRGSLPHGVGTNKKINEGEMVTIDFGAKHIGYHSDCTRTIPIGEIGKKEREIYKLVLTAQTEAIKEVKAGMPAKDIDKIARDIIENAGYGQQFGHGTGHGVGLEVHESPSISGKSDTILEEGMVITVEPGIYIPNWGGVRIEDMILVTKEGHEVLTSLIPKTNL